MRICFIPDRKVGGVVTFRAPDVINVAESCDDVVQYHRDSWALRIGPAIASIQADIIIIPA